MDNIEDREKVHALHIYLVLEQNKTYKTKKKRYQEVAKRLKKPENTIISWVRRYLEDYKKSLTELQIKINAEICNFEGLTEKQTKYIIARLYGKSMEEAKKEAGYSENTKAADIEKHPAVKAKLNQLREKLFEDSKLGAEAIANDLQEIATLGKQGIQITETIYEESNSQKFGRTTTKQVKQKREYNLAAATAANKALNDMLGYNWKDEQKALQGTNLVNTEDIVMVDDNDFE